MKLAANLSLLFTELPLLERVQAAAQADFDGVEIQFPYEVAAEQLRDALASANLPLLLINLPAGDFMQGGAGLACVPARQTEFNQALEQALAYARVARPRYVNVLAGRLVDGVTADTAWATLRDNLRQAAETFAPLGITVLCEAINPLDMPGFLVNTPEQLDRLLRDVAHDNCQAQFDFYHMARQELDITAGLRLLAGRIGHVQFADCPGRGEPGSGTLDFQWLLGALSETGYQGWLGAEYKPAVRTPDSLGWLADWRRH